MSLTLNTIVMIALAISVFSILFIVLSKTQKSTNYILGSQKIVVTDVAKLEETRNICKSLCERAKLLDFLSSTYCNKKFELKIIENNETVNKLFYCWQPPINVKCEFSKSIPGEGIYFYYESDKCEYFFISDTELNRLKSQYLYKMKELTVNDLYNDNNYENKITIDKPLPTLKIKELDDYNFNIECQLISEFDNKNIDSQTKYVLFSAKLKINGNYNGNDINIEGYYPITWKVLPNNPNIKQYIIDYFSNFCSLLIQYIKYE